MEIIKTNDETYRLGELVTRNLGKFGIVSEDLSSEEIINQILDTEN